MYIKIMQFSKSKMNIKIEPKHLSIIEKSLMKVMANEIIKKFNKI